MSTRPATLLLTEPFSLLYDLRHPDALEQARMNRRFWGKLYTTGYMVGQDHVLLIFRPAPNPHWRAWEEIRWGWIRKDLEAA